MAYMLFRNDFQGPGAPLTGVGTGVVRALTGIGKGVMEGPVSMGKDIHKHTAYERKKRLRRKSKSKKKDQGTASEGGTSDEKAMMSEEKSDGNKDLHEESDSRTSEETARTSQQRGGEGKANNALPESTQKIGEVAEDLKDAAAKDSDPTQPQLERADSQLSIVSGAPSGQIAMDLVEHAALGIAKPLQAIAEGIYCPHLAYVTCTDLST